MTTYFIHMGEMRALNNLKRLCLLDEMPDRELLIYDNAILGNEAEKKKGQRTLAECAEEISKAIDMEVFLREDFSVVVYVPIQAAPNVCQDIREVPHLAAVEMLYVLQVQYELLGKFWSSGKYPCRLHMIFGEFAIFGEHLKDVFSQKSTKLQEALWQILLPNEKLQEKYARNEWIKILEKAEDGAWSCLKGLKLKEKFIALGKDQNGKDQIVELTGSTMQNSLYIAVQELFREINKMNAGRKEEVIEQEAAVSVDHMLLEKNFDLHEQTRNEALLFFYIYGGAWKKSNGKTVTEDESKPETLVENGGALPPIQELKARARGYFQKKRDELTWSLREIDPDRAVRVPDQYTKEQCMKINHNSVKWLRDSPEKETAEEGNQPQDAPMQKKRNGLRLLFKSAERIRLNAVAQLNSIQAESASLEKRIQDYAKSLEGAYNESKYRELHRIKQEILKGTEAFEAQNIELEGSFLAIAQDNTDRSINSVQNDILNPHFRHLVWPEDISKAVEDTRKQIEWLHNHMAWKHWLLRILAAAVFVALFMAPYLWLSRSDLLAIPRLIALCVTAGVTLCAYVFSEQVFLWRYKNTVEKLTDSLTRQWNQCKSEMLTFGEHFNRLLLIYVPNLFAQYQYSERLSNIKEMADTHRTKITYHKKRLSIQLEAILSLTSDMDTPLEKTDSDCETEEGEAAQGSEFNIQLDFSAVSEKNRLLYGLTPQAALDLIGVEQAQEDE